MENLNNEFYLYTGIRSDIASLISNCSSEEEKVRLYERLSWHIKRGVVTSKGEGLIAENYAKLLNKIASLLNIETSEEVTDLDLDGDIDNADEKIFNELNSAKDILSSLDITTKDEHEVEPSEEPFEEPSEEPSEPEIEE